jgi:hypothetical protein
MKNKFIGMKNLIVVIMFAAAVFLLNSACEQVEPEDRAKNSNSLLANLSITGAGNITLGTGNADWGKVVQGSFTRVETETALTVTATAQDKEGAMVELAKITSASDTLPSFSAVNKYIFENGSYLAVKVTAEDGKNVTYYKIEAKMTPAEPPKENFHVYIAFGQSNMEGYLGAGGNVNSYTGNVPKNFMVMAAANDGSNALDRQKGKWYSAVPPLCRAGNGLTPADFFGRTIAEAVAGKNIKVGVIMVAVGGCAINLFSRDINEFKAYIKDSRWNWMPPAAKTYIDPDVGDGYPNGTYTTEDYPYKRLVDLAKIAQETGVIKGIIFHQGESGKCTYNAAAGTVGNHASDSAANYAKAVRAVYDNLLEDLEMEPGSVPFLAGQAVGNNNGNISAIPSAFTDIPNKAFVIPSNGCAAWNPSGTQNEQIHFSLAGYVELGTRYGRQMLELLYQEN